MFKFKLESILKYRKIKEDEAIKNFQLKKREVEALILKIQETKNQITSSKARKEKNINIKELILIDNYIVRVTETLNNQTKELQTLNNQLKQLEKELFKARKERKIIENLKAKKYEDYLNEIKLIEQKFLDEISSIAENRKKDKEL